MNLEIIRDALEAAKSLISDSHDLGLDCSDELEQIDAALEELDKGE